MRKSISKRLLDRLEPDPERDRIVWDQSLQRFGVRVTRSGTRSYLLDYTTHTGKRRRMVLGRYPGLTPDEARALARDALHRIAKGKDPIAERKAARNAPLFSDLAERYMRTRSARRNKPSTIATNRNILDVHLLPAFGRKQADAITRADVVRWHSGMKRAPGAANRALAALSAILTFAEAEGLRPQRSNPCRGVDRYPEQRRKRRLSLGELARLGVAIEECKREGLIEPAAVAALKLLLLTGARLGEILSARWEDLDAERSVLELRDSKTGPRSIVLSQQARAILDSLGPHVKGWILPGRYGGHLSAPRRQWYRVTERARLPGLRLHDLRHANASIGADLGLAAPTLSALLGHSHLATTERYLHVDTEPLRVASDRIGALISASLEGKPDAKVIALHPRPSE